MRARAVCEKEIDRVFHTIVEKPLLGNLLFGDVSKGNRIIEI